MILERRERERNIDLLFQLFMHSLMDSSMCLDRGPNPKPWRTGITLTNWATHPGPEPELLNFENSSQSGTCSLHTHGAVQNTYFSVLCPFSLAKLLVLKMHICFTWIDKLGKDLSVINFTPLKCSFPWENHLWVNVESCSQLNGAGLQRTHTADSHQRPQAPALSHMNPIWG